MHEVRGWSECVGKKCDAQRKLNKKTVLLTISHKQSETLLVWLVGVASYQIEPVIFGTDLHPDSPFDPFLFLSLSSYGWTLERELPWVLAPRAETYSFGKHWMWKDVLSRHYPGPGLLPRLSQCLQELPAATGRLRWQERDPGGGAEMVLERRQDGGQCQERDEASNDAGRTGDTCYFAAGACLPVHRGRLESLFALHLLIRSSITSFW